jgi:hypothetical protein
MEDEAIAKRLFKFTGSTRILHFVAKYYYLQNSTSNQWARVLRSKQTQPQIKFLDINPITTIASKLIKKPFEFSPKNTFTARVFPVT